MNRQTLILSLLLVSLVELSRSYPFPGKRTAYLMSPWFHNNPLLIRSRPDVRECFCMPGRYCEGTINSDVRCPSSYSQICCVKPEPENRNVPYYDQIDDHHDSFEYEEPPFNIPGMVEIKTFN